MKAASTCRATWLCLWFALGSAVCLAAPTLTQQLDQPEITLGDTANLTLTIQNGSATGVNLPHVDGLNIALTSDQTRFTIINGAMTSSMSVTFLLQPAHAGDFTIPAFDITTEDGGTLHVHEVKLHVLNTATAPPGPTVTPVPPASNPNFNPNGPVVMPPNNSAGTTNPAGNVFTPPTDSDGRPAKVFLVITPKTTDAYVGQTIPMRIEFYIRTDVYYQQDSLPTIDGSDFLMNALSTRPDQDSVPMLDETYERFSWVTAIEAPKSGDYPLLVDQDTYWIKIGQSSAMSGDPFANFFGPRPVLAHENISSNRLVIHVHALPEEGRPANFTGAIGEFKVSADAAPASVNVGDPVTLHFAVTGEGNFSYVKSPALAPDPNWKTYPATSKVVFSEDSRTMGTKTFEQSVIANKNGSLPLPAAGFSYFDPASKQYVTLPISLPKIDVTGSASAVAADSIPAPAAPAADEFLPNRIEIGTLQASLAPLYRKPWFWALQASLIALLGLGLGAIFLRPSPNRGDELAELTRRRHSLRQEEEAMDEAVRKGDARAFFLAARHAVQLQLGAQWRLTPEAITLAEIRERDTHLAASLEPLFTQADETIYSGGTGDALDLAPWQAQVREYLHQLQPA